MKYQKPPTTIQQQLDLLIKRGMLINEEAATHYLSHIGYYRLRGYWIPFEKKDSPTADHAFQSGTKIEDVLNLYVFDRELRLLVIDGIERIEVSVRNQWVEVLAQSEGAHAYLNSVLFHSNKQFGRCLAEISSEFERSKEIHIQHYKKCYREPDLPPIWAVAEIMTLGQFSHWLSNLKSKSLKTKIAQGYGLDESMLCSFLHHLTFIRNICAHHCRLWNRAITVTMKLPRSKPQSLTSVIEYGPDPNQAPRKIYNTLVMIAYLLDYISPDNLWKERLVILVEKHLIDATAMGFPENWREKPFWRREDIV